MDSHVVSIRISLILKKPVQPDWLWDHYSGVKSSALNWLNQIKHEINRIANFGCGNSTESFSLLWVLDAALVNVFEKKHGNLCRPIDEKPSMSRRYPGAFEGREIYFIVADMLSTPAKSNNFDMSFCWDVLYYVEPSEKKIRDAIKEMVRITKPGGWIIAIERWFESRIPIDLDSIFRSECLKKRDLPGAPETAYCYKK